MAYGTELILGFTLSNFSRVCRELGIEVDLESRELFHKPAWKKLTRSWRERMR